ncbi:uncharacterized protein LOC105420560 isoform X2 [Amborella trichopoda]|uniref:uncharacterized protein LOC105420560 isoform X2 n=1 Tax=Amborella trichopoda TaxID=13333 RepID=UPI0009BFE0FE|nr:uncharacterized protein LOC105420560 isoform X2 [Amborella trichopoda]|eukprot:XP_020522161.1 uncharacterized protein LOC105420560 isoform X2 [Amborella trichopoda]
MEPPLAEDALSLIDIVQEDDTLLQINGASALHTKPGFVFSPINNVSATKQCPISIESKGDPPITSEEPLQTRKRKKGGGYNLRKSLAWHRAFLTDEGVLDPLELSIVNGSFRKSCKTLLSGVMKEDPQATGASLISDGPDLHSIEEKLFRGPRSSTTHKGDKGQGDSSTKSECSTLDSASSLLKTLSARSNKSGSQGGICPKPPPSTSPKKLGEAKTAYSKSNISKATAARGDSSFPPTTSINTSRTTKRLKSAPQNASSVKNGKKIGRMISKENSKIRLNGSTMPVSVANVSPLVPTESSICNKTKVSTERKKHPIPNIPGAGLSKRSSGQNTVPEQVAFPIGSHLATNSQKPELANSTIHSEVILRSANQISTHSSIRAAGCHGSPASLPSNSIQSSQQNLKPSGLRMPSPTLGYFDPAKVSGLQCVPSKSSNVVNDVVEARIPSIRQPSIANILRSLHVPYEKRVSTIQSNSTASCRTGTASTLDSSVPLTENMKSSLEKNKLPKVQMRTSSNSENLSCSQSDHWRELLDNCTNSIIGDLADQAGEEEQSGALDKQSAMLCDQGNSIRNPKTLVEDGAQDSGSLSIDVIDSTTGSSMEMGILHSAYQPLSTPNKLRGIDVKTDSLVNNRCEEVAALLDRDSLTIPESEHAVESTDSNCNSHAKKDIEESCQATTAGEKLILNQSSEQIGHPPIANSSESLHLHHEELGSSVQRMVNGEIIATIDKGSALNIYTETEVMLAIMGDTQEIPCNVSDNCELSDGHVQAKIKNEKNPARNKGALPAFKKKLAGSLASNRDAAINSQSVPVPFSDEWVSALEAAGEDILKVKTGPVQNSPTDKAPPKPGPWSPVRRNNQDIGPFDCTKYTNNPTTNSQ